MFSGLDSSNSPPWGLFEDSTSSWVLYNTVQKSIKPTSPTARPAPPPPPDDGLFSDGLFGGGRAANMPVCQSAQLDQPASWAHQLARQQTNNRATASYSTSNQASGVFYARKSNFFTCTRNVSEGGAIAANGSNSHTCACKSKPIDMCMLYSFSLSFFLLKNVELS